MTRKIGRVVTKMRNPIIFRRIERGLDTKIRMVLFREGFFVRLVR